MNKIKGVIGLDIDGTITAHAHEIDPKVESFLHSLEEQGWILMFLTGRSFSFAKGPLQSFTFPYLFATQNGAALFEMPEGHLFKKHYISDQTASEVDKILHKHNLDFLAYAGYEDGDFCYWRPERLRKEIQEYVLQLSEKTDLGLELFDPASCPHTSFPMLKVIGDKEELEPAYQELAQRDDLACCMIADPFRKGGYYILINHPIATKGGIFNEFVEILKKKHHNGLITIAAGDDYNDLSMLKVAQIPIAMSNGPQDLLDVAKVIAKPASELGIIEALQQAIQYDPTH